MQPTHMNSYGLVRCTLFGTEALCGVSAAEPYEFLGFGEMHFCWFEALNVMNAAKPYEFGSLIWYECSQIT